MGIGRSGEAEESLASVRVEVDDTAIGTPTSEMVRSTESRSGGTIAVMIVGVFALLGAILFFLAPDSGQAADGTDISPPTTNESPAAEATTTQATSTTTNTPIVEVEPLLASELIADPSDLGEAIFPLEAYDSAERPRFLLDVVEFADVWVGVALGNGLGDRNFIVSTDGLEWEMAESSPGTGRMIGLTQVGDLLVVAVDVAGGDADSFDFAAPFDVRFFETADLVNWQPASSYASMSGRGAIFFAAMGEDAVAVPVRASVAEPQFDELVEFFDGVIRPERARQVCAVEYRMIGGTRLADLFDCDENVLGELQEDDAPRLFADNSLLSRCVAELRDGAGFREALLIQSRRDGFAGGRVEIADIDQQLIGLGRVFGEAYLSSGFDPSSLSECASPNPDRSSSPGWSLFQATAEQGSVEVVSFDGFATTLSRPTQAANGDGFIVGNSADGVTVARARPPYRDWETSPLTDDPNLRTANWSITPDASLLLGTTRQQWTFATPDGEVVRQLAVVGGRDAQLLLATQDYAIVSLSFERDRLVRVPLRDE